MKLQIESLQQELQNTKDSEIDVKSQLKKQLLEAQTEIIVLKQQAIENEKQVSLNVVLVLFFVCVSSVSKKKQLLHSESNEFAKDI